CGSTAGRFPRVEVFELPFIMTNAEATSKAYWDYVQTNAPDEFKETQTLALHVHGPGLFHSAKKLNKPKYEGLSAENKKVIDANSGRETSAWLGKTQQGNDGNGRKVSIDHGGTIYTLTDAEAEPFHKVGKPIDDEWVADMDKRGHDGRKLLESARSLITKYT